ncbi:MAG: GNAT family N-acetyltransferase [Bacilli bacterium]|nr:GNAT family N-acetyltransferase [Bacilli bacterium]
MTYLIKEIEKKDIYDFMYVNTMSWTECYKGIIDDSFLEKIVNELDKNVERQINLFDKLKTEQPNYKRYILYVDNEPLGVIGLGDSRENYKDAGELYCIYLLKKVQSRGYGKIMYDYAKEVIKELGYKSMMIQCIKDNKTNKFYQHMGAILVDQKPRKIGDIEYMENIYLHKFE